MKGFKSFADATVLELERGVTAVVGPNGSGKSNVVDAVTWVLGAQSAKSLRSGKMDDVIFMGTATRPALGRAEVALTLDNSDGRLGVENAEVTISRTLFRTGESEYAINGTTCRLLDIQELLSDSGVGRNQHMIIGQGQLDSILNSNPENRRAVIEEAAGVLKHRRRKERAERRLDQTKENLDRLGDLIREVRRQMRPLERQAASAQSFTEVDSQLRAARHALYGQRLDVFTNRQTEIQRELGSSTETESKLRAEVVTLDAQATAAAAEMASRREETLASALGTLQGLSERSRGLAQVINEREKALRQALIASADENVIATLEADAAKLKVDLEELAVEERELATMRQGVTNAVAEFEAALASYETTYANQSLESDEVALASMQSRLALLERSMNSLHEQQERANARLHETRERHALAVTGFSNAEAEHDAIGSRLEAAEQEVRTAENHAVDEERKREASDLALRSATEVAARTQARAEALARALDEFSGAGGRAIIGNLEGVLGAFLDLIDIDANWERAVESAAGASVGAMVVDGKQSARKALEALRREGGAGLILPISEHEIRINAAPAGTVSLREKVRARAGAPAHVTRVLDALFARAFVADNWESGIEVALANPEMVVVTADGDRFSSAGWRVASGRAVVTRGTVEEAERAARDGALELTRVSEQRELDDASASQARLRLTNALNALNAARSDFERNQSALERHRLTSHELGEAITTLELELADVTTQIVPMQQELGTLRTELPALQAAVSDASVRAQVAEAAKQEVETRRESAVNQATSLSRREAEFGERRRIIETRRGEIESRLEGRSTERAEAAKRREAIEFDLAALSRLAQMVVMATQEIKAAQEAMDSTYREQLEATRASADKLEEVRRARHAAEIRLSELSDSKRKFEIEQAELVVKIDNLHESIRRDLNVEPGALSRVEIEIPEGGNLEQVVGELEARITSLGPINPLALEELAELEERYTELDRQVSDIRHSAQELREVIRALDDEIMQTFTSAYADVNNHFSDIIGRVFPGGHGRLTLTDPEDPLNTGVEIEVRPMGRNVRRISLLSGGERSMAAMAFLFSVFRSRPSPFYMMDEVEAALDDVNLQRFIALVDEFRDEAQLVIVTHQKRTMEAADALYGVTMVPGASSKVVSQRVKRTVEVKEEPEEKLVTERPFNPPVEGTE